jgi:hypothetical protein
MRPVNEMDYHPTSEQLVNVLCSKTQNSNPLFFRVLTAYYFAMMASMMRAKIQIPGHRKDVPVNLYAINLASSGFGKGHSTSIIEKEVINQFRENFLEETFPLLAEENLPKLSLKRAARKSTDPDDELERTRKEFDNLGSLVFSFDSGTSAAVKQMRHKLLMANAGSMNLQIDEIGSNLLGNMEVLDTFIELYDMGDIKQKLTKNTSDNVRNEEIHGSTPTNMLLFGTPAKLLNGSKTEDEFYSMLETGYARRCLFGFSRAQSKSLTLTPEQVFDLMVNSQDDSFLELLSDRLGNLANMINVNKRMTMTKDVTLLMLEYKLQCERLAAEMPEHEEIKKAELIHRYWKATKLAGAYAFIDESPEVTEDHLYNAIKLVEESGDAFERLLTRDRNYVKLAKYLADVNRKVTQADLVEDLPFYKGGAAQKQEMMQLAIAYGYQNNIIIKKAYEDGIEFLSGESLKPTDLTKMRVSYSNDIAIGYRDEFAPFDQLHKLTQAQGMHWVNHHLKGGHRQEDNAIPGFNMVVIDVDGGVPLSTAKLLLKDYKAFYYTTKRHTPAENRFRIVMPLNYELKLDAKDYKEFMSNLFEWLPFEVDDCTNQRARKWLSHNGHYEYNDGELLDALPFIPKTSKNEDRKKRITDQQSLDNLERWVVNNTGDGNRNNMLLKYAMILVDSGFTFDQVRSKVIDLNDKLPDKLTEAEILGTIMVTVSRSISKQAA